VKIYPISDDDSNLSIAAEQWLFKIRKDYNLTFLKTTLS
jgi:hypothetical protein